MIIHEVLYKKSTSTLPRPKRYTVTLALYPNEGGTVTGGGTYQEGEQVTIGATASENYRFVHWVEDFELTNPEKGIIGTGEIGKAHIEEEVL